MNILEALDELDAGKVVKAEICYFNEKPFFRYYFKTTVSPTMEEIIVYVGHDEFPRNMKELSRARKVSVDDVCIAGLRDQSYESMTFDEYFTMNKCIMDLTEPMEP